MTLKYISSSHTSAVEFLPVVDLMVVRERVVIYLSTWRKVFDSMLAAMFSGRIGVLQKDTVYVIDWPG